MIAGRALSINSSRQPVTITETQDNGNAQANFNELDKVRLAKQIYYQVPIERQQQLLSLLPYQESILQFNQPPNPLSPIVYQYYSAPKYILQPIVRNHDPIITFIHQNRQSLLELIYSIVKDSSNAILIKNGMENTTETSESISQHIGPSSQALTSYVTTTKPEESHEEMKNDDNETTIVPPTESTEKI